MIFGIGSLHSRSVHTMLHSIDRGFHSHSPSLYSVDVHFIQRDVHSYLVHFTQVTFTRYSFHSSLPCTLPSYEKDSSRIFLRIRSNGTGREPEHQQNGQDSGNEEPKHSDVKRDWYDHNNTSQSPTRKKNPVVCGIEAVLAHRRQQQLHYANKQYSLAQAIRLLQ